MTTRLNVEATASFVHLFEPHAAQGSSDKKYSVQLVFDQGYDFTLIGQAIQQAITDKWGANPPAGLHMPIVDPKTKPNLANNPFYQGKFYISANSKDPVPMVDMNMQDIFNKMDLYSGCRIKANVNFFAYDTAGNRGVGCGLNGVMKLADGERLDNRPTVQQMFGDEPGVQQTAVPQGMPQQQTAVPQGMPQQGAVPQGAVPASIDPSTGLPYQQ